MKETIITQTVVKTITAELYEPFTISSGAHTSLDNVFIGIKTKEGVWGWGEAAVASHITGETISQTVTSLEKTAAWLKGRDLNDYLSLLCALEEQLAANHCALAGAGMAVLDALTRTLKMPLWRLYGDKPEKVRSDITVVIGTVEQAFEFTTRMKKRGFSIFKIKTGRDIDSDFKRIEAVRKAAPKAEIYLDFNAAYDAKTAEKFVNALAKKGIVPGVIEQPVAKNDHEGLGYLSRKLKVPICADESAYALEDVVSLIKKKQVTAINIKLAKLGMMRAREVWALARAAGIKLMMGEMMESELASTCAAQMAAGLGGFDFIDLDTPHLVKENTMRGGNYIASNGVYNISDIKAGIGYAPK